MASLVDRFEYIEEDNIDDKLKCIICTQPLQTPVSLDCQHVFCQFCIETWNQTNTTCPICRREFETPFILLKISNSNICNQLDNLLVQCLHCKKINIKRNHFKKHFHRCSKNRIKTVSDSIRNNWYSVKKTIRSKYRCQTRIFDRIRGTDHIQVINNNEDIHRHAQNRQLFTNFPSTSSSRSTVFGSHQRIPAQHSYRIFQRANRKIMFHLCIFIFAIIGLVIFKELILPFLIGLGKIILLSFCLSFLLCFYIYLLLKIIMSRFI